MLSVHLFLILFLPTHFLASPLNFFLEFLLSLFALADLSLQPLHCPLLEPFLIHLPLHLRNLLLEHSALVLVLLRDALLHLPQRLSLRLELLDLRLQLALLLLQLVHVA